ncbi:ABC-2 type transport system ATP-binding protein [Mycoplasmoides fastidiosum]|uniref:ABC-2 type transport system ATP-binding protein n=1 Tax=Mycoplasmoides fastidiosum TaxID=92758 RepID=A0ABU0LZX2_9BACT|nr:ABC transporter ATP-binding protein [Mycoplasmoides fastidiosum]MDQ0514254.1 ABC-2 type transport system ATP-binding protein [Mycoplasmoides fastidiosum]UUD37338.1 ABC transporter ATP-binding protein [Mycoplasmoides fastidiosum]
MDKSKLLIELKNINKSYKSKFNYLLNRDLTWWQKVKRFFLNEKEKLISNLNFNIYENDRIALIGNNGAGKTTLANIICGFRKATSGEIIHHYPYTKSPNEKIVIQFQSASFPQNLFVFDVLNMARMTTETVDFENNDLYKLLEISKILNKKVRSLSGGEQQRLILFTSLITDPLLLILDEYSNNLDLKSKEELGDYLEYLFNHKSMAVLIISHDAEQIYRFAKKLYLMKGGKIVEEINDIKTQFQTVDLLKDYIIKNI